MGKISGILSGVSGEYFVAAELSRRGYIASLTSKNTKGIDILASNDDASKTIGIQVKTNQGSRKAWVLSEKCEDFHSETLYYVFVDLNKLGIPDYYIVPSSIVSKNIKEGYQKWMQESAKNGKPHQANPMRMFSDKNGKFLNRWDLLDLEMNPADISFLEMVVDETMRQCIYEKHDNNYKSTAEEDETFSKMTARRKEKNV